MNYNIRHSPVLSAILIKESHHSMWNSPLLSYQGSMGSAPFLNIPREQEVTDLSVLLDSGFETFSCPQLALGLDVWRLDCLSGKYVSSLLFRVTLCIERVRFFSLAR